MKKMMLIGLFGLLIASCGGGNSHSESTANPAESEKKKPLKTAIPATIPTGVKVNSKIFRWVQHWMQRWPKMAIKFTA